MNASSPEIETICPLSSSPCSGVLKFRLASNASASMVAASAISFVWVMGVKCPFFLIASRSGDRLGCVSYSKEEARETGATPVGAGLFRESFHAPPVMPRRRWSPEHERHVHILNRNRRRTWQFWETQLRLSPTPSDALPSPFA